MTDVGSSVIKSVARVFEVFELFDEVREPLTATRVSRALDYPQSSALALLKSMVKLGYLSFDRIERTYFPTLRIALLSEWLESSLYGDGNLHGLIDQVCQDTGESVSLVVQNDLFMQFIHVQLGSQPYLLVVRPGALAPLFRSTVGLMALSERPDGEVVKLAERWNRQNRNKDEKADIPKVLTHIHQIRRDGYFIGYDMYVPSVAAVCWNLTTKTGRRSLVLSISGPSNRIRASESKILEMGRGAIANYNASRGMG